MSIKKQLQEFGDVLVNQEMKYHTSFRIGGKVRYSFYPFNLESLKNGVEFLKQNNVPFKVVGKGSNLLWTDDDLEMVVIFLDHYLCNYEFQGNRLEAEAGCSIIQLAVQAKNCELSNLEFASGIPGSVGGCVFMNAGAYKMAMSDVVSEVMVLRDGEYVWLSNYDCEFDYRYSIFKKHPDWIIVKVRMNFISKDKNDIEEVMQSRRERRIASQPLDKPSAGSTFKNPEEKPAWQCIEECGLRGYTIGGAKISDKHCNFIINEGNATAKDVKELIELVQSKVKEKFGIELKTEVEEYTWQEKRTMN
ncbi:MAG: UDP-N-acetylmuramate dehydrogenase [Erysipelotrichales bacterium]|nr:UDP-N-acetylmuramate dehydrogenase [Erysipelotrichales bacterium]